MLDPPSLLYGGAAVCGRRRSAVGKYPSCLLTRIFGQSSEPRTQVNGWTSDGLANVDFPVCVRRVGNVQPHARETVCFLAVPGPAMAQSEPTSGKQEALIAINIESLLRGPPLWTGARFRLRECQHVSMRQDVTLHLH